jgi:hypothetical protein
MSQVMLDSKLRTNVLSVNLAKNIYRKTCRTVKYHCDFTYENHKNPFLGALHFGPISLHEILPDMDKQDNLSQMRLSTSKLTVYIFDQGNEMREKSCSLWHNHLLLLTLQK